MSAPWTRRGLTWLAAATITVGLTVGCTQGDWRYESVPAAGVQADAADAKVRNLMIISDDQGQAMLLGAVATTDPVTLVGVTIATMNDDGTLGETNPIDLNEEIPAEGIFLFEPEALQFQDPGLVLGRTAQVEVVFADSRRVTLEVPIYSSEHPDFSDSWAEVYG